ncbi:hypothetical protein OH809_24355 [Streptomyces sp. NBC_00873]|uniref:hypothetical protein n=1 Tax=unclassified Streptomyces TaxID=2593676 RepID=UPI0038658B3E|nr:hypothetical protein OH809_24355 [Streptomyces sp. NBC_00873]WTA44441.1 hypothetical protein OH821_18945 [Streptomyces sp. NBC_00842]
MRRPGSEGRAGPAPPRRQDLRTGVERGHPVHRQSGALGDAPDHTLVAFTGGVRVPGHAALLPVAVGRAGRRVLGRLEERVAG